MEHQNGFHLPLLLEVKPSRWLKQSVLVLHCLVPAPILYSAIAYWVVLPLIIFLVFHYRYLSRHVLGRTYTVIMRSQEDWLLGMEGGLPQPVELLPGSVLHPALTVLRFRNEHSTISVVLTRDNVHPDLHRRLRVLLRYPPAE